MIGSPYEYLTAATDGRLCTLIIVSEYCEQIDYKIATVKFDIKKTELHLHKQLNAGVPEEHLSDYYSLLDSEEGRLSGLNEALKILQSQLLKYKADQQ